MSSLSSVSISLALCALAGARVTLPFSEVLQLSDLDKVVENTVPVYKASFTCDDGCKVYTDLSTDEVGIAQNGKLIVNFADAASGKSGKIDGYVLAAGEDYDIRSGAKLPSADFVFYVASKNAPNYDSAVYSPRGGVTVTATSRLSTFLSSANAVEFKQFGGSFQSGYPRIYATGADAVSDIYGVSHCKPVYQARSQSNAEQSSPTIFAPIATVDFGVDGAHSVSANLSDGTNLPKSATSSVVYMSPGYVGCPFEGGSLYSSGVRNAKMTDTFTFIADSLDISANYNDVAPSETVFFVVNQDDLDFFNSNTTSFSKHYEQGAFKVSLSWKRTTPNSSWALQLDFGAKKPVVETTTKSGNGISLVVSCIVALVFSSTR